MTSRFATLLSVALLVACGAPEQIGNVQPEILVHSKAVGFVQVFQVMALRHAATDGSNITCRDFPGKYQLGHQALQRCSADSKIAQGCEVQLPWQIGSEAEARAELKVPFNERLIFVVEGRASSPLGGTHAVVRGCRDNVIFAQGATHQTITLEAVATTGLACTSQDQCEPGMQCIQDPVNFPGGYCSVAPCTSDAQCPPGGVCIIDAARGNLCARPCNATTDCGGSGSGTQLYNCEGRNGPEGCKRVCVWPQFVGGGSC